MQAVLETRRLCKRFGDLIANDQIDLVLYPGEVHAVLGENGAGKSTLMKMLYGVYQPDHGQIYIGDRVAHFATPADARDAGIGMVFQNFRLIPALTVWENIALALPELKARLKTREIKARIRQTAEKYSLAVDPDMPVWRLDVGERQRVEIVKVLLTGARILLFDEPTSVLAVTEVDAFLAMLRHLRSEGYAILFITHKLREVLQVADRLTVMRRGQVVFTGDEMEKQDEQSLVTYMMGQWIPPVTPQRRPQAAHPLLEVANLSLQNERGQTILSNVSFTVDQGQIVGVAGISGNGQRELAEALLGLRPIQQGQIRMAGQDLTGCSPAHFLAAGIAGIPEDPVEAAVIPGLTVLEHMVLGGLPERRRGLGVDWVSIRQDFDALAEVKVLQVAKPERMADQLSGGNVQRLVLSRVLAQRPRLIVAAYPAHGLDIATIRTVHRALQERCADGAAVIVFSEDMNELFALADQLLVISHGSMSAPVDPRLTDAYAVARMMVTRHAEPEQGH